MADTFAAVASVWKKANGISAPQAAEDVPDRDPKDRTRTRRASYRGGKEGSLVEKWVVEGGGHTWPGGSQYLPKFLIGAPSRDFDATEEILRFFEAHGRKPEPPAN